MQEYLIDVRADGRDRRSAARSPCTAGGAQVVVAGPRCAYCTSLRFAVRSVSRRVSSASFACALKPNTPYTTCAPALSSCSAQSMFASSSKRAYSSTTTVTSLPRRAASSSASISTESTPVRYTVCLTATTSGSSGGPADEIDDRLERLIRMMQQHVALRGSTPSRSGLRCAGAPAIPARTARYFSDAEIAPGRRAMRAARG